MPNVYVRTSGDRSGPEPTFANPFAIGLRVVSLSEIVTNPNDQYYAVGQTFLTHNRNIAISQQEAIRLATQNEVLPETVAGLNALSTITVEVPPMWNRDP